jgi:hypothetical protein
MSRSKSGTTDQRPVSLAREALGTPFHLWGPEITEEILLLARGRVLDGGNLSTRKDLPKRVVKMAIIVMRALNPHEVLYQGEAAILYGLSPTTVSSRQSNGELYVRVNVGK